VTSVTVSSPSDGSKTEIAVGLTTLNQTTRYPGSGPAHRDWSQSPDLTIAGQFFRFGLSGAEDDLKFPQFIGGHSCPSYLWTPSHKWLGRSREGARVCSTKMTQEASRFVGLVRRWLLRVIDDQHFDEAFGRLQGQPELFTESRKER